MVTRKVVKSVAIAVCLAIVALQRTASAQYETVDLSGKWQLNMFGTNWTVELKREPSQNPTDRIFCGEAKRERRDPDTPDVVKKLCASIEEDMFYASVPGMVCKATYRATIHLDGSCGGSAMISSMESSETRGMFQATRLSTTDGKKPVR